ncbi:MAG: TetR/AcrR family transcriptional regulator [Deltaproteobacteria bacterium]|nr:TetR/AcrR family transcriptional regulator [Deltaproteobacteria bacterium]
MKNNVPRTKEKEVRIREIQEAAKKVFIKKGFQRATIDEIANMAGTSKGTVYLYFKNKDDLYVSLMLPGLEKVTEVSLILEEKLERKVFKNPHEFVMEFCNVLMIYYEYDPEGFSIFRASQIGSLFSDFSPKMVERINRIGRKNFEIARRTLDKAIKAGLFPPFDVVKAVDVIWGLFIGTLQVELDKLRWTKKDHIRDTLQYGFALIANGLLCGKELVRQKPEGRGIKK